MSQSVPTAPVVEYPDSDGQPMSDNTIQFRWISILKWNAEGQFRHDLNVFVAADHLIYPVQGDNTIRQAPDVYVAFGRPKGDRGSYKVWDEDGIFPQVIFEVWSPGNTAKEMQKKFEFYELHGAEEYYIVHPEPDHYFEGWQRKRGKLVEIPRMESHRSPRLGWTFRVVDGEVQVWDEHDHPLRDPSDIIAELEDISQELDEISQELDVERERAEAERERAERLAAKLRALGIDPDSV